jgi:NADH dehydrogenase
MNIVLVGGSGFLGQYLVHELVANGHKCTVLSRNSSRRRAFKLEPATHLVQADVYDPGVLATYLGGADAVISMAGILNESGYSGKGFKRVHVDLPEMIAETCVRNGIRRLIHISALNAGKGKSHYLVSKGQSEALLLAHEGLDTTIFQPSVIFGRGDLLQPVCRLTEDRARDAAGLWKLPDAAGLCRGCGSGRGRITGRSLNPRRDI